MMGPSEFEAALDAVEHLLGDVGQQIRFAFDVWRKEPVNPAPFHAQVETIDRHRSTCIQLLSDYNESLAKLRGSWHGAAAEQYLGVMSSAFQSEHNLGPPGVSTSQQFHSFISMTSDLLDFNLAGHQVLATKLEKTRTAHGQLNDCVQNIGGTLIFMAVTAWVPVGDIATEIIGGANLALDAADAVELAGTVKGVAEAVNSIEDVQDAMNLMTDVNEVKDTIKIVKTVWTVGQTIRAIVTLVAVVAVVGVMIVPMAPQNSVPGGGTIPGGTTSEQDKIDKLRQDYPSAADQAYIDKLLALGFSADQIRAILEKAAKDGNAYQYDPQLLAQLLAAGLTPADIARIEQIGVTNATLATIEARIQQAQNSPNHTDQYGLTAEQLVQLFAKIGNYGVGPNAGAKETALLAFRYTDRILAFDQDVFDANGKRLTDFDIVLPEAIIEVKTGEKAKPNQTATQVANSNGKPVVVYGPEITTKAAKDLLRAAGAKETANTPSDLDDTLKAIQSGITDPQKLDEVLQKIHGGESPDQAIREVLKELHPQS